MKKFFNLVKETFQQWSEDKASRLAASLSFYTMLSISPLLVIAVAIIGFVFGSEEAQQRLLEQVSGVVGPEGTAAIQTMLENASQPDLRSWAGILGIATLIWGASNVFSQLHDSMNLIWNVELKPGLGIMATIKKRLLSFSLVAVIGFLLLVSLVLSAVLTAVGGYFSSLLPGGEMLWQIVNFAVSLLVITGLFAMIYRVIPDVKVSWRDMWLGAFVTALLFVIGKELLSFYLGRQSFGSTYGAAGSLVVLLVWIYYSAQIFFFGAEFTQVYATRYGRGMTPEDDAQFIDEGKMARLRRGGSQKNAQQNGDIRTASPSRTPERTKATPVIVPAASTQQKTAPWFGAFIAGLVLRKNMRDRR